MRNQDEVDPAEPHHRTVEEARQWHQDRESQQRHADNEGNGRTGQRNAQFGPGRRKKSAELGHPAEKPEHDALDLHSLPARDDRMAEFVEKQRNEEQHGSGGGHRRVDTTAVSGVGGRAARGSREGVRISARITGQLQLMPISTPASRPS